MLFSSITFLYCFLPLVLVIYFLVPGKLKNMVLLIASLLFYAFGEPKFLLLMIITIVFGYMMGILTEKYPEKKKIYLSMAVIFDLGALTFFKYADFFISSINAVTGLSIALLRIALPIGISFYTFQILSYNIDVYRGEVPAQKSLIQLATYISMFPQLIAGPIVRYKDISDQLVCRKHSVDKIALGIRRFVFGLAKKVLIANSFGELCTVFRESGDKSVLFYWMYAIAFSFQIYYDFSGYSDMAIGLGKIFGFDFMENFNYPYISKSITEFWRRWHISLGTWFRDYVYIPLGGSRVGTTRRFMNIFVVWMLTGLWHGAAWNFVIWGVYFAVLLIIEKLFLLKYLEMSRGFSHLYVLFMVILSFVIFNGENLSQVWMDIGGMFGFGQMAKDLPIASAEAIYYLSSYFVLFVISVLGATPVPKLICKKLFDLKTETLGSSFAKKKVMICIFVELIVLIGLLILVTAYLVDGSFNPFLYFRF